MGVNQPFASRIDDLEELLTTNRIFKQPWVELGVLNARDALSWGVSGVLHHCSGVAYALRKAQPYEWYDKVQFDVPVGANRFVFGVTKAICSLRKKCVKVCE